MSCKECENLRLLVAEAQNDRDACKALAELAVRATYEQRGRAERCEKRAIEAERKLRGG